ncbi:c-type cytochrome [Rhodophyticola porphyridii]|nr:cytochrome c [Rhodophyticola porphyridii]
MMRVIVGVMLLSIPLAAWLVLVEPTAEAGPGLLEWRNAEVVDRGAALYAETCAVCHGIGLEGERDWQIRGEDGLMPAPPHDETGHTWHHPDEMLFAITKYGSEAVIGNGYQSNMIGFGEVLSDEEILAVLAYIKSTWPENVIEIHDEVNANAAR